ncbi:polymer-forming cytoskeletal protein [Alphaproteobacteria bacterium]|nr:polymer-forming cytoskeletal protein [Alphaproteobacteria bacterium]
MQNLTRIDEKSSFRGNYSGLVDLELYGKFEGSLMVKTLYVKKSGVFIGYLTAENVEVEGKLNANIQTENLHLKSEGIVDGEVFYRSIVIESGGLLKSNMVQNISKMKVLKQL